MINSRTDADWAWSGSASCAERWNAVVTGKGRKLRMASTVLDVPGMMVLPPCS